jgi:hypothetical protein
MRKRKEQHPTAVYLDPPVPMSREIAQGDHLSARVLVPVEGETPPSPIPFGAFYGIGRAPNDIEPHRHIVLETDIPGVTTHVHFGSEGGFMFGRPLVPIKGLGNYAEQMPVTERVNIGVPEGREAPGSRVELVGRFAYHPDYAKLY